MAKNFSIGQVATLRNDNIGRNASPMTPDARKIVIRSLAEYGWREEEPAVGTPVEQYARLKGITVDSLRRLLAESITMQRIAYQEGTPQRKIFDEIYPPEAGADDIEIVLVSGNNRHSILPDAIALRNGGDFAQVLSDAEKDATKASEEFTAKVCTLEPIPVSDWTIPVVLRNYATWGDLQSNRVKDNNEPGKTEYSKLGKYQIVSDLDAIFHFSSLTEIQRVAGFTVGDSQDALAFLRLCRTFPLASILERFSKTPATDANGKKVYSPGGFLPVDKFQYPFCYTLLGVLKKGRGDKKDEIFLPDLRRYVVYGPDGGNPENPDCPPCGLSLQAGEVPPKVVIGSDGELSSIGDTGRIPVNYIGLERAFAYLFSQTGRKGPNKTMERDAILQSVGQLRTVVGPEGNVASRVVEAIHADNGKAIDAVVKEYQEKERDFGALLERVQRPAIRVILQHARALNVKLLEEALRDAGFLAAELAAEPVAEPAAEPVAEPAAEPAAEPVAIVKSKTGKGKHTPSKGSKVVARKRVARK